MKKEFLSRNSMFNTGRALFFLTIGAVFSGTLAPRAQANPELDRKYALETVGYLRAWDNVDGLFGDYVSAAYKDYFSRQSRFILQDLSKADSVLAHSKLPYNKLLDDSDVLGQIARATKSQSVIRTKIRKEGPQYRFTFDWLHSPQMDLLGTEEFVIREHEDGKGFGLDEIKAKIQESLDRMIAKVPFAGAITGRDNNAVTVNIGSASNLKAGDTLVVGTLDEVKKHPLLHEIVDWRLTSTGKVQIDSVEERIAFGRIVEEEPGRQVARYQKVLQIIPNENARDLPVIVEKASAVNPESPPTLGWIRGSALAGGFSRQFSSTGTIASNGSGLLLGTGGEGQLWLTREWFAELGFNYGFWSYSQTDIATGNPIAGSVDGSFTSLKIAGGYSYLVTGDVFGPKAWVKAGLHSVSYSLPIMAAQNLAPISFKSPFLGVGGDLPIRGNYGALLNLEFGLFPSGSETGNVNGSVNSASDVDFFIGGYYRWNPRMTLRAGVEIIGNNADYGSGSSLSQKIVTFAPTLVYYF